jgi:hypothetical protein
MSSKPSGMRLQTRTLLRQVTGRYATKFTPGGREKRIPRAVPSLPKLKCLEETGVTEEIRGPEDKSLPHPRA